MSPNFSVNRTGEQIAGKVAPMKTLAELYATSGYYPDTGANRRAGLVGEPWPVPCMTDTEMVGVIKHMRTLAHPNGGHQDDPIMRNGRNIN